jgi:hypothetical protein
MFRVTINYLDESPASLCIVRALDLSEGFFQLYHPESGMTYINKDLVKSVLITPEKETD